MELEELESADDGASTNGQRDTVGGGDAGVGSVGIEVAGAAGGQDDVAGADRAGGGLAFMEDDETAAFAGLDDEVNGHSALEDLHRGGAAERGLDLFTGAGAGGMQNPGDGMGGFESAEQLAGTHVEVDAGVDEAADGVGALVDQGADHHRVAEAGAGDDSVQEMEIGVVVDPGGHGDAALGVVGVGLGKSGLGEHGNGAVLAGQESGLEPGNAAAYDEELGGVGGQEALSDSKTVSATSSARSMASRSSQPRWPMRKTEPDR